VTGSFAATIFVIPAQAGISLWPGATQPQDDPGLRRDDGLMGPS